MSLFSEENIQRMFGHEAAEDENPDRLREYYFKTSIYDRIVTNVPLRILVGHKGIGKSALFKVAIAEDRSNNVLPILIQPNDILNLGVDVRDFLHTVRSWKDGIAEIITHKALSSFGLFGKGSLEITDCYCSITDILIKRLLDIQSKEYPTDKQAAIWQFLESQKISVYVDDLDRGWQGRKEDIVRISALLNAIRDLSNENRNILFRIALRSDVYYLVRTSDESTDKIEGSVIWHTWTNHEILVLLIKRIETYFGHLINEANLLNQRQSELAVFLSPVLEPRFSGKGHWEYAPTYRVLMSLIRRRPRDLVKLCTLAARHAYLRQARIIEAEDFKAIFEEYSHGRILDTINEYRSELPDIERLVMNMKPSRRERTAKEGYVYRTDKLLAKINSIIEQGKFIFSNGKESDSKDLAAFLYKINFLTARKESESGIVRKYFEENRYLSSRFVDFGFDWEIHPAYRWALQPTDISDYFPSLNADD
ncbi:MAG: hypothetical protein JXA21_20825 [Anaerolineae bacterium]|nr:hypothetical protein [Anaerolineae bacterium]